MSYLQLLILTENASFVFVLIRLCVRSVRMVHAVRVIVLINCCNNSRLLFTQRVEVLCTMNYRRMIALLKFLRRTTVSLRCVIASGMAFVPSLSLRYVPVAADLSKAVLYSYCQPRPVLQSNDTSLDLMWTIVIFNNLVQVGLCVIGFVQVFKFWQTQKHYLQADTSHRPDMPTSAGPRERSKFNLFALVLVSFGSSVFRNLISVSFSMIRAPSIPILLGFQATLDISDLFLSLVLSVVIMVKLLNRQRRISDGQCVYELSRRNPVHHRSFRWIALDVPILNRNLAALNRTLSP